MSRLLPSPSQNLNILQTDCGVSDFSARSGNTRPNQKLPLHKYVPCHPKPRQIGSFGLPMNGHTAHHHLLTPSLHVNQSLTTVATGVKGRISFHSRPLSAHVSPAHIIPSSRPQYHIIHPTPTRARAISRRSLTRHDARSDQRAELYIIDINMYSKSH